MVDIAGAVVQNEEIMPGVQVVWLEVPSVAARGHPGQFFMVGCGDDLDPLLRRPLSWHRSAGGIRPRDEPDRIALMYSRRSRAGRWLVQRREGDAVPILGPLGKGFHLAPSSRNLLLVGAGLGIAPLIGLAEEAIGRGLAVTLVMGADTAEQLYPLHLLPAEVEAEVATHDGSAGHAGQVTDLVPELLGWADQVCASGPHPMYASLAQLRRTAASHKSFQVLLEAPMACGFGACLGCATETRQGYRLVCRDGPMFELRNLPY